MNKEIEIKGPLGKYVVLPLILIFFVTIGFLLIHNSTTPLHAKQELTLNQAQEYKIGSIFGTKYYVEGIDSDGYYIQSKQIKYTKELNNLDGSKAIRINSEALNGNQDADKYIIDGPSITLYGVQILHNLNRQQKSQETNNWIIKGTEESGITSFAHVIGKFKIQQKDGTLLVEVNKDDLTKHRLTIEN